MAGLKCDTGLAYRSVIVFGTLDVVDDVALKRRFFETFLAKYGTPGRDRPRGFFPRVGEVTVYAISIDRITGKECPLPEIAQRWPALDRTKSPNAIPP